MDAFIYFHSIYLNLFYKQFLSAYPYTVCLTTDFRRAADVSVDQRKASWETVFLNGAAAESVSGTTQTGLFRD